MNILNKYIYIYSAYKRGYEEARFWRDSINFQHLQSKTRRGRVGKDIAQTLDTGCEQGIAIPVLTPDISEKKQNGRRVKEDGEPSFMLTAKAPQGVAVLGGIGEKKSNSGTQFYQQDRIHRRCGLATSLNSQLPGGGQMYGIPSDEIDTVYYPKRNCYIAIRKLTPKECFRLQGFSDDLFEKAAFVNSDSQLYKQAGNSCTVQVTEAVGRAIAENDIQTED